MGSWGEHGRIWALLILRAKQKTTKITRTKIDMGMLLA
jgi:hypothetical protein